MSTHPRRQAQLGDLIVAAFDGAARYSTDPRVVARLATQVVTHLLAHGLAAAPAPRSGEDAGAEVALDGRDSIFPREDDVLAILDT